MIIVTAAAADDVATVKSVYQIIIMPIRVVAAKGSRYARVITPIKIITYLPI